MSPGRSASRNGRGGQGGWCSVGIFSRRTPAKLGRTERHQTASCFRLLSPRQSRKAVWDIWVSSSDFTPLCYRLPLVSLFRVNFSFAEVHSNLLSPVDCTALLYCLSSISLRYCPLSKCQFFIINLVFSLVYVWFVSRFQLHYNTRGAGITVARQRRPRWFVSSYCSRPLPGPVYGP